MAAVPSLTHIEIAGQHYRIGKVDLAMRVAAHPWTLVLQAIQQNGGDAGGFEAGVAHAAMAALLLKEHAPDVTTSRLFLRMNFTHAQQIAEEFLRQSIALAAAQGWESPEAFSQPANEQAVADAQRGRHSFAVSADS